MAVEVAVPSLGLGWKSGRITHWYRPDGANVSAGEPVFCLESDYVTVDVEAETAGVVRHRPLRSDQVTAGEVVALVLAPGERLPEGFDEPAGISEPEDATGAEAFECNPSPQVDGVRGATGDASDIDASDIEDTARVGEVAEDEPGERQPASILPLRRTTLPEPPPVPGGDSSWEPVPGDGLRVAEGWMAGADLESGFDASAQPGEPPVKHPDEDPRDYFDIAPLAPGVTRAEDLQPSNEVAPATEPIADKAAEEFEASPATVPGVQYLRTRVDLREVRKMCAQLAREWQPVEPRDEDVLVRAAGKALGEFGLPESVALVVPERDGRRSSVLSAAASTPFRAAVEALAAGWSAPAEGEHGFELVSFAEWGIDEGSPELTAGRPLSLSVGAVRELAVVEGNELVPAPMAVLTLAYDPSAITPGQAAWFLARVRDLLEAPYALLAA